jgi:phenylacetate-CoA ligase
MPGVLVIDEQWDLLRLLHRRLPSADAIEAIRLRRLKSLLRYAYQSVPFYRELFQSRGLVPDDIRSVDDLRLLPAVDRDRLRAAGNDRISTRIDPSRCRIQRSSGSSGKPWPVWRTPVEDRLRRAVELRSMVTAGIRRSDRIVTLGPVTESRITTLGHFGMYPTSIISTLLPPAEQTRLLREMQPSVFWVYPTALRALLRQVGTLSSIIRPRMVVTSAEPLDELLRDELLSDRPVELRNFYGSVEVGRISFDCPAGEGLHINTDCSILQFDEEEQATGVGRPVIVTNLNSRASPYIRYRLGDYCQLIEQRCSCGSPLPLMKPPKGRVWDVIRLPGGGMMAPWACNSVLRGVENLLQFRLIQMHIDRLQLQLQFSEPPSAGQLNQLNRRLQEVVGESVAFEIELVDGFENEKLKFRAFISELE